MFVCVFIDWENVEKTAKQEFGSVLNFEEFVQVIRSVATSNGSRLVGIQAYGDFDKGTAGLMSTLINLGIEPRHVVTKTAQEYLKGSTDIELSLDILETMYNYPHITDFLFVSGDSDLRHVIKRLQKLGKNLRLLGFKTHTSQFIIDMVNEFILLDDYPNIMRKVTQTEKEQMTLLLLSNEYVRIVIEHVDRLEKMNNKDFIGLNYLRKRLIDHYKDSVTQISDALTHCIDYEILNIYQVPNPNDPKYPTRALKLNRENQAVQYVLNK
ncbi:NYN domain protein [Oxobacter pfennigii]|uniref:NYN domain protein n=1 Tax=Oxobacter pfennigii TaxID=36849 RepID=A0A0P8W944_9CLOT|nr:NYN domain-containing protein [Oxobacter pfennigii]KPU45167.1 NYN domain protein [Oxobacter pfennigii]